ncbi:MAG: EpsI family protein [Candidatus Brocadia sp.]|nr:EpsI family protein [Candidatus Brocadia sp.]
MNTNKKGLITIIILLSAIIYCFGFHKTKKYESLNILSELKIPLEISGWQGSDVEQEWNKNEEYNFISQALDREYVNMDGKNLFLLILDAGNFHNPKVCVNGSGFKVIELNDSEFHVLNRSFQAHSLYAEKDADRFLIIYWICIDKNIVDWTGQKIKRLWLSLIDKKSAGLMIRLDIPTKEDSIEDAFRLAKEFIADFGQAISPEQAGYIFGNPVTFSGLPLQ